MYTDGQLAALADRKLILQARIAVRRLECAMAAERLARPLAGIDRLWGHWKRLSPWVKLVGVPLGLFTARKLTKSADGHTSKGRLAAWLAALPVVMQAWKGFRDYSTGRSVAETRPSATTSSG